MISLNLNTRSSDEENNYFYDGLKPKKLPEGFDESFCFKIKGSINPSKYMNQFCDKLIKKFGNDNCYVEPSKNKLKLIVQFDEGENDDEENKINKIKGNDVTLKIKLYESKNGFILKFFKVKGSKNNFYDKFTTIANLVKNIN